MAEDFTEMLPEPLPADPLAVTAQWLKEAFAAKWQPNPNAMVLATSSAEGRPTARVVLCRDIVPEPGYVVFYTNYLSAKGKQLKDNPRAAAVIHWDAMHRQVRLEGPVTFTPGADSDRYFAQRAWPKRIAAWASAQSEPLASRAALLQSVNEAAQRFGTPVPGAPGTDESIDHDVPRPPHWGGYRLWVEAIELWVEGDSRVHDRARWVRELSRQGDGTYRPSAWSATRLQP
ncbi:MAG: pyridoxamine 5'-phosphate oxidase [Proteobacteria bacterium]|nr:pyridoxamine 5'-phosphate oxidase [Pseudomonadota bacterium]